MLSRREKNVMLLSLRIAVLVGMRLLLAPVAIIRFVVKGFGDLGERERERERRERGGLGEEQGL